jgi:hypothetical protein
MPVFDRRSNLRFAGALALSVVIFLYVVHVCAPLASSSAACDFSAFYSAGLTVRTGEGRDFYDLRKQAAQQQQLFHRNVLMVENNAPFEALLLAPFSTLSFARAYELWGAVNVGLWILFVYLLRSSAPASPRNPLRNVFLSFMFYPVWAGLLQGQRVFLMLVALTFTFLCLKRGRDLWAGVFLGLGLFKFTIVLPFAFICLLRPKWRVIAGSALSACLLGMVSTATVGLEGVLAYARLLVEMAAHSEAPIYAAAIHPTIMPNVRGFLSILLSNRVPPAGVTIATVLLSCALLLLIARQWRRVDRAGSDAQQNLMFAAAVAGSVAASLHSNVHDLTMMLPAILLVLGTLPWRERFAGRYVLAGCVAALCFPPVYLLLGRYEPTALLAVVIVAFAWVTMRAATAGDGSGAVLAHAAVIEKAVAAQSFPAGEHERT